MPREGVTVLINILNEAQSLESLLRSILGGRRAPDELIVLDAGSRDGSQDIVRRVAAEHPAGRVRLIESPGATIGRGRNIGIEAAQNDIVAITDGSCRVDPGWLAEITAPFEADPTLDVVGGNFVPEIETPFQRDIYPFISRPEATIAASPSSRSIAMRRSIWRRVGGYPEWLPSGEDTYFNIEWRKAGARYAFARDAIVHKESAKGVKELVRRAFLYGGGDGQGLQLARLRLLPLLGNLIILALIVAAFWQPLVLLAIPLGIALALVVYARKGYLTGSPRQAAIVLGVAYLLHTVGSIAFVDYMLRRAWWEARGRKGAMRRPLLRWG